jgi:8-oxo-dGTP diphosphatase
MKQEIPVIHVVGAVIFHLGKILACRRALHKINSGLWEFPGGKVEKTESSIFALERELLEELGVRVKPIELLDISETLLGDRVIRLETIICKVEDSFDFISSDHDAYKWLTPEELPSLAWAAPDMPAVRLLSKRQDIKTTHV